MYPENWPLAEGLIPADLDADSDLDLLEVAFGHTPGPDVGTFWYPNIDGLGNFGPKIRISELANSPTVAVDLDGDKDLDILSGARWYENTDGLGSFGLDHDLLPTAEQAWQNAVAVDFDHDGDVDLVTVTSKNVNVGEQDPCTFAWLENVDGKGHFGDPKMIGTWHEGGACSFLDVADVGADGDSDLISISNYRGQVAWLENMGGDQFREPRVVSTQVAEYNSIIVSDLDGDNHSDFIVNAGEWRGQPFWYVRDGEASFEEQALLGVSNAIHEVSDVADINGDGRLDIIGSTYHWSDRTSSITWHENRIIGDSNHDQLFNSSDLVTVFQTGKYEDGISGNATFDEGDWNQDGDFTTADLVLAFQSGTFVATATPKSDSLAAAVDRLLAEDEELGGEMFN